MLKSSGTINFEFALDQKTAAFEDLQRPRSERIVVAEGPADEQVFRADRKVIVGAK
jgi:hypothetical protein